MVWSAGQREFIPLLMGLYWLLPASKTPTRGQIEWVAIEEPEMGLHPLAISATLVLVMDLLKRGYRVCVSTHTPHVLDVVWGIKRIQKYMRNPGKPDNIDCNFFLDLFSLPHTNLGGWARQVLEKEIKVYYFNQDDYTTEDISELDPASENGNEAGWGGLTGFSGQIAEVVSKVVRRANKVS